MIFERMKVFIVKHKIALSIISIICIATIGFFASKCLYQQFHDKLSDTVKGIIGTLLGAIVGGSFSLMGSLLINSKAQKAQNAIRRCNVIFKPLYDELMIIHHEILVKNPYPSYLSFKKGSQTELNHPQYVTWGRIKNDTRLFETPKKLIKAMDELYDRINNYLDKRSIGVAELDRIYRKESKTILGIEIDENSNAASFLLKDLLMNNRPSNTNWIWQKKGILEEDANRLWDSLIKKVNDNRLLQDFKESWESWYKHEQYVLELLGTYIQYVVEKYEG